MAVSELTQIKMGINDVKNAIRRDDLDGMIYEMRVCNITTSDSFDGYDVLYYALKFEAVNCARYLLKRTRLTFSHFNIVASKNLRKMVRIIIDSGLGELESVEFLDNALINDNISMFFLILSIFPFKYDRYGPQLVERACIISDYEEVLDHLFQNGTPLDKDYIFEIIKKCNRWYDGLHYLMKKGYKLSRYVSRGRTVFTEMERRALLSKSVHYDYVSEIYLYLIRYGYDVNERESVEPYKAGYEVIPVKCEEYLWDVVLKSTPVEMLAEHFILGNDRDRMEYLFENGLSKKFRIGPQRVLMYDFTMKNHAYKSAHVLYNHDKSFDPRYFFDKKLFLESLVKRGELDFVAALCEDGIGFAEQDFKDPRCDRCSKSFHCACVAGANVYRILNAGETHIPALIYSILANENDDTAIKGLEVFKKLKKLDIDLQDRKSVV